MAIGDMATTKLHVYMDSWRETSVCVNNLPIDIYMKV